MIFLFFRLKKYVVEPAKVDIQELINKLQKLVDDYMYTWNRTKPSQLSNIKKNNINNL